MKKLWFNGLIYSLNEDNIIYSAMITEDKKVLSLGSYGELNKEVDNNVEKIDLHGKCVMPSFTESHIHFIGHGDKLLKHDYTIYKRKRDLLHAVKEQAMQHKKDEWLIVESWNEEHFKDDATPITKQDLDSLDLAIPVCAKRTCRHVMTINTKGLELLNLSRDNGLFFDEEQFNLLPFIEKRTKTSLKKALNLAIEDAWKFGITEVHTEDLNYYGNPIETFSILQECAKVKNFPMHLLVHYEAFQDIKSLGMKHFEANERIELGAMKMFLDGSLGAKTALLTSNYEGELHSGVQVLTNEELESQILLARNNNLPIAVHVIGDLACQLIIEAIKKYPLTKETKGVDRIIHAQLLNEDIINQIYDLPIMFDLQPTFIGSDYPWLIDRVGEERAKYAFMFKTMKNKGWKCSFSSDSPIEDINPFKGIYYAVTRKKEGNTYNENEKLTVLDAVQFYTQGANHIYVFPQKRGMIKATYDANFIVLNQNIFDICEEQILETEVLATIFEGNVVYKKSCFNLV